jgi:glycosyltransferase involved in cell wall biosynthesis
MRRQQTTSRPFFSVVIPLYNKRQTVERAVRSVLTQEFTDWELIVVDDGSTDQGSSVLSKLQDRRLRLVRQPNQGVSVARNRGVEGSQAEYVAFLDADDQWHVRFLSTIRQLVRQYPLAGQYATAYRIVESTAWGQASQSCTRRGLAGLRNRLRAGRTSPAPGSIVGDTHGTGILANYFRAAWSGTSPVSSSSVCVRKSAFEAVGGFPAGIRSGEDTAVWARLALASDVAVSDCCQATYFRGAAAANTQYRYFGRAAHFDHACLLENQADFAHYADLEKWVAQKMVELAMTALVHGNDRETVRDILCRVSRRHWRLRRMILQTLVRGPAGFPQWLFRVGRPAYRPNLQGACQNA